MTWHVKQRLKTFALSFISLASVILPRNIFLQLLTEVLINERCLKY